MNALTYLGLLGVTLAGAYALQPDLALSQPQPLTSFTQPSLKPQSTTAQLQRATPNQAGGMTLTMQTSDRQRFLVTLTADAPLPQLHLGNWYRVDGTLRHPYLLQATALATLAQPLQATQQTLRLDRLPIPLKRFGNTSYLCSTLQGTPLQLIDNQLQPPTPYPAGYYTPSGAFQVVTWQEHP